MGINKENLLSDEHHASHFSCAICQDLSESPATLACSHVFCEFCIGEYVARCLDRQQNALCPTCPRRRLFDRKKAQRQGGCVEIKRRPPRRSLLLAIFFDTGANAVPPPQAGLRLDGRPRSLQGHLTNSDMSQGRPRRPQRRATSARAYDQAAELYSKAAAVAPEPAQAFANRAACRLMAHRYEECPGLRPGAAAGPGARERGDAARAGFAGAGSDRRRAAGPCSDFSTRNGAGAAVVVDVRAASTGSPPPSRTAAAPSPTATSLMRGRPSPARSATPSRRRSFWAPRRRSSASAR